MFRIILGLHESILFSFMVAGHTKFLCDAHFGQAKKKLRKTFTSSLFDVINCIEESSKNNVAELVGLESGKVLVPVYDWHKLCEKFFKELPGISQFHHFRMTKDDIGVVYCRKTWEDKEIPINILKGSKPKKNDFPKKIVPKGLTEERKKYLFEKIRKFCTDEWKDTVAPNPDVINQTPYY